VTAEITRNPANAVKAERCCILKMPFIERPQRVQCQWISSRYRHRSLQVHTL